MNLEVKRIKLYQDFRGDANKNDLLSSFDRKYSDFSSWEKNNFASETTVISLWNKSLVDIITPTSKEDFFKTFACDLTWAKQTTYCGGSGPVTTTPDPNTNTNNNNSNNPGLVNTTLTGDELKAGKIVKRGMKGDIVGQIQDLLIKLGYINVSKDNKTDKIFGSRTEKMVKDFQTANKLSVDGQVSKETWPKLNDPAAVKKSASSTSGAIGGAQAEVPKDGETTAGSDVIIKESLKIKLRKNLLKFN